MFRAAKRLFLITCLVIIGIGNNIISTTTAEGNDDNNKYVCDGQAVKGKSIGRISHGVVAKPGQVPWQVLLNSSANPDNLCGGSIISSRWILSQAQCFYNKIANPVTRYNDSSFTVYAGSLNRSRPTPGEQKVKVERVDLHPNFKPPNTDEVFLDYDFALVYLSRPLTYTANIKPICLPARCTYEVDPGTQCVISGWGSLNADNDSPSSLQDSLMMALVPFVARDTCNKSMHDHSLFTSRMVCAGTGKADSVEPEHGDGGGPMACQVDNGDMILHGVTSWGESLGVYGIYARPCSVMPWICSTITSLKCPTTIDTASKRRPQIACGMNKYKNRVIEKPNASVAEFPWLVRLLVFDHNDKTRLIKICVGSLINDQWILTSAICLEYSNTHPSDIVVQLNITNLNRLTGSFNATIADFDVDNVNGDIALLRLESNVTISDFASPICPQGDCGSNSALLNCTTVGWQTISSSPKSQPKPKLALLRKAFVNVADPSTCQLLANNGTDDTADDDSSNYEFLVASSSKKCDDRYMCAFEQFGPRCLADIGGPLMCKGSSSKYFLYGIASSTTKGCDPNDSNAYVVYSTPWTVKPWISQKLFNS